jgi:hypothetical protein
MKFIIPLWFCIVFAARTDAQNIRVNGEVKTLKDLPVSSVVVMAFDGGRMIKSYVTDDRGEYSFYVEKLNFDVLFYKPGMRSHTCRVVNKMEKETQGVNLNIQLDDSTAETAVDLSLWLNKRKLTASYIDSVYAEDIRKMPPPKQKHQSKKQIEKAAMAEQKRFANYKESTVRDSVDHKSQVTTTVIGADTYECITSERGAKRYEKNTKPITEATYKFETTRRYDGVLKSSKNVRKLDKYKPMQHVKAG